MRHVLSADEFDIYTLADLFRSSDEILRKLKYHGAKTLRRRLPGRVLYRLFYEPSTRTYESFGFAATHLGMDVLGTQSVEFSSVSKGETLPDTIRTICRYLPDVIVLRSKEAGQAAVAASYSNAPIINAGDGKGEHPTQAVLDLYTIQKELGRCQDLHVLLAGDLANGRTVRSLVKLLIKYPGNRFTFVAPPMFGMSEDIKLLLRLAGVEFTESNTLYPAIRQADVVYQTRVQSERFTRDQRSTVLATADNWRVPFPIGPAEVEAMHPRARLLHPLPRVGEISPEVDSHPKAAYFRQMHYGMVTRMALIEYLLGSPG